MPRKKRFSEDLEKLTVEIPASVFGEMSERVVKLKQTKAQAVTWGLEKWLEHARAGRVFDMQRVPIKPDHVAHAVAMKELGAIVAGKKPAKGRSKNKKPEDLDAKKTAAQGGRATGTA